VSAPKTATHAKLFVSWFLGICALLCAVGVVIIMLRQKPPAASQPASQSGYATTTIKFGDKTYNFQIADTPAKQELGLSGRENLQPREGMLFTYNKPSEGLCFWMKDMRFSLDIIWLDSQKRIVHIEPSLAPATYPNTFCPGTAAQYVVEINAGRSRDLGLQTGQKLDFLIH